MTIIIPDTYIEQQFDMDAEPQCDYSYHGPDDPAAHDTGPATFIIRSKCPRCGTKRTKLACTRRAQWAMSRNRLTFCSEAYCHYTAPSIDFLVQAVLL